MKDLSPQEKEDILWTSLKDHILTQGPWLVYLNIKMNPKDSSRPRVGLDRGQLTSRLSGRGISKAPAVVVEEVGATSSYRIRQ